MTGIRRDLFCFSQTPFDQQAGGLARSAAFFFFVRLLLPGAVSIALPCWSQPAPKPLPAGITLVDVTAQMHLALPPLDHPRSAQRLQEPIPSGEYSLAFARQVLLPAIGGSVAAGDSDGSGYPDLYVVVPGGSNHFFRNLRNGTFVEITKKAGVPGTGPVGPPSMQPISLTISRKAWSCAAWTGGSSDGTPRPNGCTAGGRPT